MCQRVQNSLKLREKYGRSKLIREVESQDAGDADGDVGVAGEIAVDLERVEVDADQQDSAEWCSRVREADIDQRRERSRPRPLVRT